MDDIKNLKQLYNTYMRIKVYKKFIKEMEEKKENPYLIREKLEYVGDNYMRIYEFLLKHEELKGDEIVGDKILEPEEYRKLANKTYEKAAKL
jgi:regulator of sigma D